MNAEIHAALASSWRKPEEVQAALLAIQRRPGGSKWLRERIAACLESGADHGCSRPLRERVEEHLLNRIVKQRPELRDEALHYTEARHGW